MNTKLNHRWLILATAVIAASCGGGGSSTASTASPPPPPPPPSGNQARIDAASATAKNNSLCKAVQPFYWEIGDSTGALGSGSVDSSPASGSVPNADTAMTIASASKLPFAAYVVEKYNITGADSSFVPYLNFTSGYSNFDNQQCLLATTVSACNNGGINAQEAANHIFHYEGGHMQQLAAAPPGTDGLGFGNMTAAQLTTEVDGTLGLPESDFAFVTPQPAGGIQTTAREYAVFLRRLLADSSNPLRIATMLDDDARCTQYDPTTCPNAAPPTSSTVNLLPDNFHYGLGHWIEDDPVTSANNQAYSSAGAHGFYPWVSKPDRKLYGVLARNAISGETNGTGEGYDSLQCGRLIRKAWTTSTEQTGPY